MKGAEAASALRFGHCRALAYYASQSDHREYAYIPTPSARRRVDEIGPDDDDDFREARLVGAAPPPQPLRLMTSVKPILAATPILEYQVCKTGLLAAPAKAAKALDGAVRRDPVALPQFPSGEPALLRRP
jgi:hypothetical protein